MNSRVILSAFGLLVFCFANSAHGQQHSASTSGPSTGTVTDKTSDDLQIDSYIHVGKAVNGVETIEIVATLVAYEKDAAFADYVDQGYAYDISTFEVIEPSEHRGKRFQVLHDSHVERASVWCSIHHTYLMLVDREFIEDDGFFGGPELITIKKEKTLTMEQAET